MSRAGNEAYNYAMRDAYKIVESCVSSIEARIAAGEISRDSSGYSEELSDAIHEEADDSCIYTSDCWILAYGLREADIDDLGGFDGINDINAAITRQAYANLCAALSDHDFNDAFAVAEDQAAESNPPETDAHKAHTDFYDTTCAECMEEKKIAIEKGWAKEEVTP